MDKVSGIVEKIWQNQLDTGDTTYTIVIDGERYGCYTNEPKCKAGDSVELNYTSKGKYKNADVKSIKKVAAPAGAAPKAAYGGKRNDDVQNAITYQAARKDALQLTEILVSLDILDVGNKSKGAKVDVVLKYVDGLTKRFYEDTKTLGHEAEDGEESDKPAAKPKAKAKPAPEPELEEEDIDDDIPF